MFGNDVKDYFNHCINDVSELALMQIVWVGADDFDPATHSTTHDRVGNHLVFVVERRMGFGIHPNAGIAQELSEAVDYIFRRPGQG